MVLKKIETFWMTGHKNRGNNNAMTPLAPFFKLKKVMGKYGERKVIETKKIIITEKKGNRKREIDF